MTTLGDIVNDTLTQLHGQTADLEQAAFLTQDITSSALTFAVDDATQISRGLIEIDDELLWVTKIDSTNNLITIAPPGRGQRGSTPAAHSNGTMVTDNPRFPRIGVIQAINQALSEAYPEVFVVRTDESNFAVPVQTTYPVPANCDSILNIKAKTIGPSQLWEPIRRYDLNTDADTTYFPTGRSVDIGDGMFPGQPIRITYISRPAPFVNDTDTLASIGMDDNIRDVLMLGACYRLVAGLEISRLQNSTVEQGFDKTTYVGTTGAATAGSKYYLQVFQARLANERDRLLKIYPTYTHMSR